MKPARRISGVFAPIPTPFAADGEIDYRQLRNNVTWWGRTGLAGLVVSGSNGESAYLAAAEKLRLTEEVRAALPPEKMVITGTGVETTRETIQLSRQAAEKGADACLVLTPHYYKGNMTPAALKQYFWDVAEACPVPVMLYNMPRNTGLNMEPGLVCELAGHPNIAGIKDSSGNIVQISEIAAGTGDDFAVFAGSGSFLLATLVIGGVGGTLAVANVMPDECAELLSMFKAGNMPAARALQLRLLAANKAVTSRWGIPGLKAALDLMGKYGGPTRRPLLRLGEAEREQLRAILVAAGVPLAG